MNSVGSSLCPVQPSLLLGSCIVLYCIGGMVIADQCTATFSRSIVLPEFRY